MWNLKDIKHGMRERSAQLMMLAVALMVVLPACSGSDSAQEENGGSSIQVRPDTITVTTTTVKARDFERKFEVNGTLMPRQKATLNALVGGKVTAVDVDISDEVREGERLLQIRKSDYEQALQQAKARLEQAKVSLKDRKREMKRTKNLYEAGSATQKQRDQAQTAFEQARAALMQAKAAYQQAQQNMEDATVTAPYDGVITDRMIDNDEFAQPGQPVFEIMDLKVMEAEIDVPERYIGQINKGLEVNLRFKNNFKSRTGKVVAVNPKLNRETRTFRIKIDVNNEDLKLPAGLFTVAQFDLPDATGQPAIPKEAVTRNQGLSRVWLIRDGEAHAIDIREGQETEDWLMVRDGLQIGDRVAVGNTRSLIDGYPVNTKPWNGSGQKGAL